MRELRTDMADTVEVLSKYDNRSKHHTAQKLNELMDRQEFSGYPISGDDLALATYEKETK